MHSVFSGEIPQMEQLSEESQPRPLEINETPEYNESYLSVPRNPH